MRAPARVIDWNGTDLPPELAALPPGRYRLERIEGPADEPDDDLPPETRGLDRESGTDVGARPSVP